MLRYLNDAIRRLTNNQPLAKIAPDFHIAAVLKRCQCQLRELPDGLIRNATGGVQFVLTEPGAEE